MKGAVGPPAVSEDVRQLVHIGFGACALLLRWLSWFEATMLASMAVAFNLFVLHRLGGARLFRPDEHGRYRLRSGIVLYPASVVGLLLLLPGRPDIVAGAWGVLAAGDGAATLIGRHAPIRPLPWNRDKSLGGTLAFVFFGSTAAALLMWWCRETVIPPAYWWYPFAAAVLGTTVAAAVETIPVSFDDNVSVAGTAAVVMWVVSLVSEDLLTASLARSGAVLPTALVVNALVAALGYAARSVSLSGAVAGAALGTIIFATAGWQGWTLLLATFGAATIASRFGWRRKASLGIEEARGGRRGATNAIANTGVATVAAVMSVVSFGQTGALVGFAAALAAGGSDTVASEIGKAWGRRTFLITTGARVAAGTPGAVSIVGTLAGLAAAAALGSLAAALYVIDWNAVLPVVVGATAGALLESVLGATLEQTGVLNNDILNFINTAAAAYVAMTIWGFL
jgi:uncharacterized protein (TIGR00297 family)